MEEGGLLFGISLQHQSEVPAVLTLWIVPVCPNHVRLVAIHIHPSRSKACGMGALPSALPRAAIVVRIGVVKLRGELIGGGLEGWKGGGLWVPAPEHQLESPGASSSNQMPLCLLNMVFPEVRIGRDSKCATRRIGIV